MNAFGMISILVDNKVASHEKLCQFPGYSLPPITCCGVEDREGLNVLEVHVEGSVHLTINPFG